MKEIILISGVTGLTSSNVYERLKSNRDYEVIGFSRNLFNHHSEDKKNLIEGDASDFNFWLDILLRYKPQTILIHSNLRHFLPFLKAFKFSNLKEYPRVIIISTTGIYSKFKSFSSIYKDIEEQIKSYKGSYTILRPSMIYGSNKDKNISRLIKFTYRFRLSITFGKGLNKFQPIYFEDLSDAINKVVLNKNIVGEYNLTGKDCLNFNSIVAAISNNTKRRIFNFKLSLKFSAYICKIFEKIIKFKILPVSSEQIFRMSEDKCFDNSKAKNDFGFNPIGFEKGLKLQINQMFKGGYL